MIVAAAVLVSGCSGGARRQAAADESPTNDHLGELRIGITEPIDADPATVNPARATDVLAADLLYDGLTSYDPDSQEATPALATGWETPDGVTWTFHLDAGRRFSNGAPVTAAAVVSSIERVRARTDVSLAAARLGIVSTISAVGTSDVQIVLGAPNYELPALLADPAYGIVGDADVAQEISSQAVVSGRFKVQSGGSEAATMVAIDGRDLDVDGVEFVKFDDAADAQQALRDGKIDIAPLDSDDAAPEGSSLQVASAVTLVLEIASANGALAEPANRAAILAGLDRSAIAAAVTGDAGRRADTLVPGGVVQEGPCLPPTCPSAAGGEVAAGAAAAVGPLRLDVAGGAAPTAGATEIARQLTAAGLTVEVHATDGAGLEATLAAGQLQLAMFVVVGGAPTPDPYLSAALSSVGSENLTGYADPGVDAGLAAARATSDAATRRAAYLSVEATSLASAPVIPSVTLGERFAVSDRVVGVEPFLGRLFDGTKVSLHS